MMATRSLLGETSELPTLGGLRFMAVGAEPGHARLAVILCHGFASSADDLIPVAKAAFRVHPELAETVRFYFPAGVVDIGDPVRAWWPVDGTREALEKKDYATVRAHVHMGSSGARRAFTPFLDAVLAETGLALPRLVIGGFSQGGLLAVDTALRLAANPAGIIVMSSMTMSEPRWREMAPARAGTPAIVTHGARDPLIDLDEARHLASLLEGAGLPVTFHSFDGSHTVDVSSAEAIAAWLRGLLQR